MNLSVEIKGKGLPILCLHGHPGNNRCLSVFTNHLSQKWQTIAPDLRGYGKSRTSKQFQMNEHLEDLEKLIDLYKLESCLLLGWSLGGILALELVLRQPKRFQGLVLVASAARPRGNHPAITPLDLFYSAMAGVINYLKPGWQWNIDTFGKRSLFRYLIQQHTPLAYNYLATEGTTAYLQTSRQAEAALNLALKSGYNRLEDLSQIQLPCLLLAGAEDRHITAQSSLETAQQLPNCQWRCYPQTAHLFPWEIPSQVLQDLDEWLVGISHN